MNKGKDFIAWLLLMILIFIILFITYIKYFSVIDNKNIEETPINESSSIAIHKALSDITTNFNNNTKEYANSNNITLNATANNYSIFISYVDDTAVTYEFNYENLFLNIIINNDEENITKFNVVYKFLIESTQERLNNQNNINDLIEKFLTTDNNYDGLIKTKSDDTIKYQMNITKTLENGGLDDGNTTH